MDDNVLDRIPGDLIARAIQQLPNPPTAASVVIDVPYVGRVRVFCVWKENRVHRGTAKFWSAHRAEFEA